MLSQLHFHSPLPSFNHYPFHFPEDAYPVIIVNHHQQHHNHFIPTPKNPSIPSSLGTHRKVKEQAREIESSSSRAASAAELSVFREQTAPLSTPENKSRGQNGRPLEKKRKGKRKPNSSKQLPFPVRKAFFFLDIFRIGSPLPLSRITPACKINGPPPADGHFVPFDLFSGVISGAVYTQKTESSAADAGTFCSLYLSFYLACCFTFWCLPREEGMEGFLGW
ncbi:hypothetical protein CEXT_186171 [Caerostris extrusa]|uniref:Uncharacterized protein n=1 Tax=Caerostris extrusa TaxID=172846 RepID=A0AAV4TT80_CAEEX|nr:hypothetical protein CEXT_186171 [Caerostris extrusa]